MKKWLFCSLCLALSSTIASADSSDRTQPINVESASFKADQINQTAIYVGNVILQQGTLRLTGNKLEIHENAKGYRQMTLTGKLATLRQRRDPRAPNAEEWIEAEAQTIIYEESTGLVTLIKNAKVIRTENGIAKDQTEGDRIVYDTFRSRTIVQGSQQGRMSTVIAPRKKTASPVEEKGPKLNSSTGIISP